jgi:GNAT superfamily N-acetyltransferase
MDSPNAAPPETLHALLLKRMDALYRRDAEGRLLCTNEWERRPAPRFHLMRTAAGPIFRFRADVPEEAAGRLAELCEQEPADRAFEELPFRHERYLAILAAHAPVEKQWSGPAYMSVRDVAPSRVPVTIDGGNADLLRERFADWLPDVPHRRPFVAMIEDGHAVALCASVRISAAVHCAGVETHSDYRRRGYASAAVAGWARAVKAQGATPFYSTSWDNIASRHVAGRLGMALVGVDFHVT